MSVRESMKYSEAEVAGWTGFINDDDWVMQQKMDGTRGLAVISTGGKVWWPGRGGKGALAHTAATQHLPAINAVLGKLIGITPGEIVLDGEIMIDTGEFHIFDMPYARFGGVEMVKPTDTLTRRTAWFSDPEMLRGLEGTPVKIVRTAWSAREKAELLKAVEENGGEGVMVKHVDGDYQPGKRVKHSLKCKFVKTADVIVQEVNRPDARHGSITFGVVVPNLPMPDGSTSYEFPEIRIVGRCSAIGKPEVEVGDVIEVNYLSWTGAALYQPRMVRVRDDKDPMDCRIDQFRNYSKAAV